MIYGYARCCTTDNKQDINRQIRELKAAGADEVIFEYEHGDAKVKKNLHMLLDAATEGDTIITLEVSRLSRSTQQLCEILETVKEKHLRLIIVGSITVDCREGQIDPMSQAFIQMSGVFAELELSMIRARVRSGMENAKAKGKKVGRPKSTRESIPAVFHKHYCAAQLYRQAEYHQQHDQGIRWCRCTDQDLYNHGKANKQLKCCGKY